MLGVFDRSLVPLEWCLIVHKIPNGSLGPTWDDLKPLYIE